METCQRWRTAKSCLGAYLVYHRCQKTTQGGYIPKNPPCERTSSLASEPQQNFDGSAARMPI